MTVGVSIVCGPWLDGIPAVAHHLAAASPDAALVRSTLAPELPPAPPPPGSTQPNRRITLIEADAEVAHRTAGCPCCAVRLDLLDVVGTLARRRRPPRHIVIEALPLDDPAAIVQTLLGEPGVRDTVSLDAVVAVVHGPTAASSIVAGGTPWNGPAADAVRMADRIVVGEADHLTWRGTHLVGWTARAANRAATVDIVPRPPDPSTILDARAWTPGRLPERLRLPDQAHLFSTTSAPGTHDRSWTPGHQSSADTGSVLISVPGSLDEEGADEWLDRLHATSATRILRFEAILSLAGRPSRWLATGLRTTLQAHAGAPWSGDEPRASHLRLVGDGLDHRRLAQDLAACSAP